MLEEEWKAPQSLRELEVVRELGVGSYARVLHVRRRSNGEEYALKVMNKAFLLRENKGEAVKRERELLELLCGTPGMVRLAFSFQDALSVYLATEVCHGDLQAQLARRPGGRADAWEARFWTAELALALHALHAHSCVHRDVKPENVLLDARGHVRLCDFGSAKRLDALPAPPRAPPPGTRVRNGTFAGTAEYCAPELIQGLATSCAADFWSLGCLLFQALVRAASPPRPHRVRAELPPPPLTPVWAAPLQGCYRVPHLPAGALSRPHLPGHLPRRRARVRGGAAGQRPQGAMLHAGGAAGDALPGAGALGWHLGGPGAAGAARAASGGWYGS